MKNPRKAAIIGLGNVGASIAFALMQNGLYSEIVLIDYNKEKAEGEAMDLCDGLPYTKTATIYAGDYKDVADASMIVITAGTARKPGQSRIDLIYDNVKIMKSVISQIKSTEFDGILLIVSNPVDIMTHIALKLSGYDERKVIGSGTVLDTARLKSELARSYMVDQQNVHTMIIGEHGDSQVPVWSISNISGIGIQEFCQLRGNNEEQCYLLDEMHQRVKNFGAEIIKRKGATYYGIAMAVSKIASSIVRDELSVLPVSVPLHGQYGLDGVHLSVPCILGSSGVNDILEIKLNDRELSELRRSGELLKNIITEIEEKKMLE